MVLKRYLDDEGKYYWKEVDADKVEKPKKSKKQIEKESIEEAISEVEKPKSKTKKK